MFLICPTGLNVDIIKTNNCGHHNLIGIALVYWKRVLSAIQKKIFHSTRKRFLIVSLRVNNTICHIHMYVLSSHLCQKNNVCIYEWREMLGLNSDKIASIAIVHITVLIAYYDQKHLFCKIV